MFDEIERMTPSAPASVPPIVIGAVRAELELAAGEIEEGLRLYRVAGTELDAVTAAGPGARPASSPGCCSARPPAPRRTPCHGAGRTARTSTSALRDQGAARSSNADRPRMDYPVVGMVLLGLGTWGLLKRRGRPRATPSACSCSPTCSATTAAPADLDPARDRTSEAERVARRPRRAGSGAEYGERTRPGPPRGGPGRRSSGIAGRGARLTSCGSRSGPRAAGRPPPRRRSRAAPSRPGR